MRVLITPDWYPWPEQPLAGVFCREQAHAVSRIAEVAVLTWRRDTTLRVPFRVEDGDEDGLRTLRVRYTRTRVPRSGFAFKLAGSLTALALLGRNRWFPDVIHAHEYGAAPVALTLSALTRAPMVMSEHYSGFALGTVDGRERRRAQRAFARSRVVCPVSHDLARHLQTLAPEARFEPVPNVVDTDTFAFGDWGGVGISPRLITVGALVPIKGHEHLIGALGHLRRAGRELHLDIVGDGPQRDDLARQAREAGVEDLVTFHGRLAKPEVAAALRRADAFVLPSLWENLPCAMLEAMAVGLPIVATRVGGVPEVLERPFGVIVEPGSAGALQDGIVDLLGRLGDVDRRALRRSALARFGYDAISRRWMEVYASVLERAG